MEMGKWLQGKDVFFYEIPKFRVVILCIKILDILYQIFRHFIFLLLRHVKDYCYTKKRTFWGMPCLLS